MYISYVENKTDLRNTDTLDSHVRRQKIGPMQINRSKAVHSKNKTTILAYFCYLVWQLALSHKIRSAPQALVSVMVQNWPVTSLKVWYSYKSKIIASCQQSSWWKSFLAVHDCTGALFSSLIQDKNGAMYHFPQLCHYYGSERSWHLL